jgi:phosphoribosyl-ATP pyrophosphohydrolase
MMGTFDQLNTLAHDIAARRGASAESSYTAKLLSQGVERCAKKFGEEAVELTLAAVQGKTGETAKEAADVLYHLLVLLEAAGVSTDAVMAELRRREGTSGHTEKAARRP